MPDVPVLLFVLVFNVASSLVVVFEPVLNPPELVVLDVPLLLDFVEPELVVVSLVSVLEPVLNPLALVFVDVFLSVVVLDFVEVVELFVLVELDGVDDDFVLDLNPLELDLLLEELLLDLVDELEPLDFDELLNPLLELFELLRERDFALTVNGFFPSRPSNSAPKILNENINSKDTINNLSFLMVPPN